MECEYPIDTQVTDTKMSALGLACSLNDTDDICKDDKTYKQCNAILLDLIMS